MADNIGVMRKIDTNSTVVYVEFENRCEHLKPQMIRMEEMFRALYAACICVRMHGDLPDMTLPAAYELLTKRLAESGGIPLDETLTKYLNEMALEAMEKFHATLAPRVPQIGESHAR